MKPAKSKTLIRFNAPTGAYTKPMDALVSAQEAGQIALQVVREALEDERARRWHRRLWRRLRKK